MGTSYKRIPYKPTISIKVTDSRYKIPFGVKYVTETYNATVSKDGRISYPDGTGKVHLLPGHVDEVTTDQYSVNIFLLWLVIKFTYYSQAGKRGHWSWHLDIRVGRICFMLKRGVPHLLWGAFSIAEILEKKVGPYKFYQLFRFPRAGCRAFEMKLRQEIAEARRTEKMIASYNGA